MRGKFFSLSCTGIGSADERHDPDGIDRASAFQVLFLFLHDWVPLGRFTNLKAVAEADPLSRRVFTTFVSGVFFAIGLWFSLASGTLFPQWLLLYLLVSYALLFAGELRAWWIPYFGHPSPEFVARYRKRFEGTLRFLPERNGTAPDALHVLLHATTLATVLLLIFVTL